jgi:hypothetical protein
MMNLKTKRCGRMERGPAFIIRLCSDRAAYEAVPRTRFKVDLARLRRSLEHGGNCETTLWTRQLMVVKQRDATEITIVDDGRLVIRNVADEEAARKIAETMLPELVASKH